MRAYRIVGVLFLTLSSWAAGQNIGQQPDPPPVPGIATAYYAVADIDQDGQYDVVRSITNLGVVEIWRGQADETFVLEHVYQLDGAGGVALGDLDSDGSLEIIVASKTSDALYLGIPSGPFSWNFGDPIFVGIDCGVISTLDICDDQASEIVIGNDQLTTQKIILEPLTAPVVYTVTSETRIECGESADIPCGDEPDCDPAPQFPGIWECLRAADCRRQKCHWAACINCHDGNGCHWWERPLMISQHLACALVYNLEVAGCLGAVLP